MRLKWTAPISVFTNRLKRGLTMSLPATLPLSAKTEGIIWGEISNTNELLWGEINSTLSLDIKVDPHYRASSINYPPEACFQSRLE